MMGFAPAPVPQKVTPGQLAVSKPDKDGLVTMVRPVVTRLHADDPLRVALHWATEKGPIPPYRDNRPFSRTATLRSMTFVLTGPDGKKQELKADVPTPPDEYKPGLFYSPTIFMTLTKDGLTHDSMPKSPWSGKASANLERAGVYKLKISGTITDGKEKGTPFESGEISVELGVREIRSQDDIVKAAREALKAKAPEATAPKVGIIVTENAAGNRLVRFRTFGKKWNYIDYIQEMKPDGTPVKLSQREVFTCVARGTLIDTERGLRPIETVREGDRVWGYDGSKRVLTTVRLIRKGESSRTLLFCDRLRVTPEHPVWVSGSWKPAGSVSPTDLLLDSTLRRVRAGQPRIIEERIDVYDLTVDAPHCFFAGGLLVHNKDRAYSPNLDDPWYDTWRE
jgi:hypothetical protein